MVHPGARRIFREGRDAVSRIGDLRQIHCESDRKSLLLYGERRAIAAIDLCACITNLPQM